MNIDIFKLKQLNYADGKDYLYKNGYVEYDRIIDNDIESCDYIIDIYYINNTVNHKVSYTALYNNLGYEPLNSYWAEA